MKTYMDVEDLEVCQKLCRLHIEICDLSHAWPSEERYEIGSQIRRSSNSSPAQLAEKNDDRHVRNKIEGVNRSRGELRKRYTICLWQERKLMLLRKSTHPFARDIRNASGC